MTELENDNDESSTTKETRMIREEKLNKIKDELEQNLQEEHRLLGLQMKLSLQLEQIKAATLKAEGDGKLAKLALQQAKIQRMMMNNNSKTMNSNSSSSQKDNVADDDDGNQDRIINTSTNDNNSTETITIQIPP